ncbi:unnamed protein product [Didymodactylos carnosus]|uniref:Protein kinase domain-containing protein n=1 Tax=Didymodactylos carnosus TaxID=1234261 RepID=A0A814QM87_9BILA|nr:unnamed protein product [Didymodactylos carnosus]CAF1121693.1 unnamed protein product [Didymodactylos carnosus]CAF3697499.1 unnamed protein product [Didymodactylos carnosus]CAF3885211.1 unnamed protein product [Didymodactylos carnosus]
MGSFVTETSYKTQQQQQRLIVTSEEFEFQRRGFKLGSLLGEGSYAKVKTAFSERLNRKIAIKIVNRRKAPIDFQQRFLPRELSILQNLDHPHIIKLYEIFNHGHKVYMILELAGHGDLLDYIKLFGRLPEDRARKMFQQLVSAIEYLHNLKIVHRDLKCENILLDSKNDIKVSDFGFSRLMLEKDLSSTFCGSASYAAPEVLKGTPYIGPPYDCWSLGVVLYIMVYGTMPFDDSNVRKLIRDQLEKRIHFSRRKAITDECKQLILLLLEPNVKQRGTVEQIWQTDWINNIIQPISARTSITYEGELNKRMTPPKPGKLMKENSVGITYLAEYATLKRSTDIIMAGIPPYSSE